MISLDVGLGFLVGVLVAIVFKLNRARESGGRVWLGERPDHPRPKIKPLAQGRRVR